MFFLLLFTRQAFLELSEPGSEDKKKMSLSPALRDLWEDITQTHQQWFPVDHIPVVVLEGIPDPMEGNEQGTPDGQNRADVREGCIELEKADLL